MSMPPNHEWTPERVKELTGLWATGLSASEIGRRLGITKNAVVGKVRRLDLAMRRAPTPPRRELNVVTLDRLKANQCCWPEGEPGEENFRFCGKSAVIGKPYCESHCAIAYVPPKKKTTVAA
ncbi:MAG: GcrA family cell cycle regulator [Pseudomonadota bacterium]|nr:GcrA family cell cycle regulator [Pseudomonadota bacterium]